MANEKILIADDDREFVNQLAAKLRPEGFEVITAYDGDSAVDEISANKPTVVILDWKMPGRDFKNGLDVMLEMQNRCSDCTMIMLTGEGNAELVARAYRAGAFEYKVKTKPVPFAELVSLIRQAIGRRNDKWVEWPQGKASANTQSDFSIVGYSPEMLKLLGWIGRLAKSDTTVLLLGETGSGKELVAREIHNLSGRHGRFVARNCSAIVASLAESELFGSSGRHDGGRDDRPGAFELANHGTLFLDELGDLELAIQAKLLRVIQERKVQRLFANTEIPIDVRIISATNKNLEEAMGNGEFRKDLFNRLAGTIVEVPPLRNRPEDIPELVHTFMKKKPGSKISHPAMEKLLAHDWPGNVRELQNAIWAAMSRSGDGNITAQDIVFGPSRGAMNWAAGIPKHLTMAQAEQAVREALVMKLMEETAGNQAEVARRLAGGDHPGSRTTVLNTIKALEARGVKVPGRPTKRNKTSQVPESDLYLD